MAVDPSMIPVEEINEKMTHRIDLDDIPEDVYTSDEVEWGGGLGLPSRILHNRTEILDQGATDACGTVSLVK